MAKLLKKGPAARETIAHEQPRRAAMPEKARIENVVDRNQCQRMIGKQVGAPRDSFFVRLWQCASVRITFLVRPIPGQPQRPPRHL
jgi:hypothetical protein